MAAKKQTDLDFFISKRPKVANSKSSQGGESETTIAISSRDATGQILPAVTEILDDETRTERFVIVL